MAQPWPHPKTGMFWFRRVVPNDLRAIVGKWEERLTLGTKDPAEARVRYAKVSAEVEARWANLRAGTRALTERECHALAAQAHDTWLRMHADEPSQQFAWHPKLYRVLWSKQLTSETPTMTEVDADEVLIRAMRRLCYVQADNCLAHHGLQIDDESRLKLAKAIAAAFQRASQTLIELSAGVIAPEPVPEIVGEPSSREVVLADVRAQSASRRANGRSATASSALSMNDLFEAWWREAQASGRKPSTHESYRNTVRGFIAFLKHDEATRVTPHDVVAFKDHRLSTPSPRTGKVPSAKTVKDSDLSALKTLFGWAVMNHKLPMNPAAGLSIKIGRKQQTRPKGFTDAEARAILAAALAYVPGPKELPQTAAAKRCEPRRAFWRLQFLREWSHDEASPAV
ncbi:DUF6538 domain-containing protein [Aureimonas leprariae]|uniref:Core-binding (CB) domain-containing protein n=1 Tax=Plantimonas leprariae TaxID=2615207 RepID=A0A7V7PK82_9HYPH|nr:DUF6538 domain-containing protein [Aureimonas leprariae]KAB0676098.1 hypothetical protein F6X38_22125 [Aureimonas leprariae]